MKLGTREKFAYGLGDFGINMVFATTSSFLSLYYTDVALIGAATVGTILLIARVIDAFWDLFFGAVVDRTRTRWGQCRPYLLLAMPLLALLLVLTFSVPEGSMATKVAYAMVTYTLLMCLFSVLGIPYSALPALMTDDARERTRLAAWRMFLAMTGSALVSASVFKAVAWLGAGNAALGYQRTMMVAAVVAVLTMWVCFWFCKERVAPVHQPMDVKGDLKALMSGRAWLTMAAIAVCHSISLGLMTGLAPYFVKYVLGNESMMVPVVAVMGLGLLSGVVASVWLTTRWCKRQVMIGSSFIAVFAGCALYFVPLTNLWWFGAVAFMGQVAGGIGAPIAWSMIADTADDAELRTGRRMVGLASCSLAFAGKLGFGIGGAMLGFMLGAVGYQPNVAQTPQAINGLLMLGCFGPAAVNFIGAGLLLIYPLGQVRLDLIRVALQRQRAAHA